MRFRNETEAQAALIVNEEAMQRAMADCSSLPPLAPYRTRYRAMYARQVSDAKRQINAANEYLEGAEHV